MTPVDTQVGLLKQGGALRGTGLELGWTPSQLAFSLPLPNPPPPQLTGEDGCAVTPAKNQTEQSRKETETEQTK